MPRTKKILHTKTKTKTQTKKAATAAAAKELAIKEHPLWLTWLQKWWQPVAYVIAAALLRFWNFRNSLYFIYDQGRDALVLEKLAHGHLVLVGPTSGLNGFFLGPLWYYLGLPGYLLFGGNPYGICLWYITISCVALPLFWILAHRLFHDKLWVVLCAVLLAIIPGSIQASIFIWNPLLSVPLMTGAALALMNARKDRWWLVLGFFCLALTLQSEFAYGVFFLPVLFVLIPWLRGEHNWRDFAAVIGVGAVTALPQALFELRNHFIMTTSLLHSLSDKTQSASWQMIWALRPTQLLTVSQLLVLGEEYQGLLWSAFLLLLIALAFFAALRRFHSFEWKLIWLLAIIPYPFYMLWRGNHGYFFSYYLTPHFVFLVPILVLGLREIWELGRRWRGESSVQLEPSASWLRKIPLPAVLFPVAALLCLAVFVRGAALHWDGVVGHPENNAGLAKMISSVGQIYAWHQQDATDPNQPWIVKTYTANVYTEQYDYLLGWYAQSHHLNAPQTVLKGDEKVWYIMIESRAQAQAVFFDPWYKTATAHGRKIRETQIGVLTLETWRHE